jgi:hypothetical protein
MGSPPCKDSAQFNFVSLPTGLMVAQMPQVQWLALFGDPAFRAACCGPRGVAAGRQTATIQRSIHASARSVNRPPKTPARSPGNGWRRSTTKLSPREQQKVSTHIITCDSVRCPKVDPRIFRSCSRHTHLSKWLRSSAWMSLPCAVGLQQSKQSYNKAIAFTPIPGHPENVGQLVTMLPRCLPTHSSGGPP